VSETADDANLEDQILDGEVRRADPDRWMASRFIGDPAARAAVVALYALNHELARAGEVASNPLLAEIRLTWWREAMEELAENRPARRHPLVQALARSEFDPAALASLVEARFADLDAAPAAMHGMTAYIDGTAGAVMAMAARRLHADARPDQTRAAARAFATAGLMRSGRWPAGLDGPGTIKTALREGAGPLRSLPVPAFPAAAYATLARQYGQGASPSEVNKRLRLTLAVLTGRV
jgi:phytoene synthase